MKTCLWVNNKCEDSSKFKNDQNVRIKLDNFQRCPDYKSLCVSNLNVATEFYDDLPKKALADKYQFFFTMGSSNGDPLPDQA
jgi:hypothetical protein